MPLKEEQFP